MFTHREFLNREFLNQISYTFSNCSEKEVPIISSEQSSVYGDLTSDLAHDEKFSTYAHTAISTDNWILVSMETEIPVARVVVVNR